MASYHRTEGFVFKKEDSQEADRIFSVFSKDFGKIKIVARSIRKINSKLKGGMEIFYLSDIAFVQGKHRKTLVDVASIEKFSNIFESPEKISVAHSIAQIINNFIKGEEQDERIFNFLHESFNKLNGYQLPTAVSYQLFYHYFFWNFITILGYGPELFSCTVCRQKLRPDNLFFSSSAGGVVCYICCATYQDKIAVTADFVKVLRMIVDNDWGILFRLKMENNIVTLLNKALNNHCLHFMPESRNSLITL